MSNINEKSPKKRKSIVKPDSTPKKLKTAGDDSNSAKKPNKAPNKKAGSPNKPGPKGAAPNKTPKVVAPKNLPKVLAAKKSPNLAEKKKKFAGTAKLNGKKSFEKKLTPEGKRATLFYFLQQKLNSLSQEDALKDIDKRIAAIKSRKIVSKTGKRKIKNLQRYKDIITQGLKIGDKPAKQVKKEQKPKLKVEKVVDVVGSDDDDDDEDSDDESSSEDSVEVDVVTPTKKPQVGKQNEPKQTVFITNLGSDVTKNDVNAHLKSCGTIVNIQVAKDKKKEGKQIAFVTVPNNEVLQKILAHNGTSLKGENIEIKLKTATPVKQANKKNVQGAKKGPAPGSAKQNRKFSKKSPKNLNVTS